MEVEKLKYHLECESKLLRYLSTEVTQIPFSGDPQETAGLIGFALSLMSGELERLANGIEPV